MKIAAVQMVSTPRVEENLTRAETLIAQAAAAGARLVALPEYFCFMGARDRDKLDIAEPPLADAGDNEAPIQRALTRIAREQRVWLIGGTVPLRCDTPERARNASCVFDPDGRLVARYDKIHLFRFETVTDGVAERYDEGRVLQAGSEPAAFEADGLRVGLSVCYDLRFPELYRRLMEPPCDLLAVPAAFTYPTGRAHWELLLRARAVENQCYVIAAAQGGVHETGRRTYGHSMIVDPWGEVVAVRDEGEGEGVVLADLDRQRIATVREQLPALAHRRLG